MKKITFKIVGLACAFLLMLGCFAGCTGVGDLADAIEEAEKTAELNEQISSMRESIDDVDMNDEDDVQSTLSEAEGTLNSALQYADDIPDSQKYDTVEKWFAAPSVQSELQASISANQVQGINMDIKAEGNSLIYEYKYTTAVDAAALKSILESSLDGMASYMETLNDTIQACVKTSGTQIVVKYLNADGSVIAERTFK